jgi:hypothetical protein
VAADAPDPFAALRAAAREAARGGPALIVVEASPDTLAAVARWLAAPGPAAPAPERP